MYMTSHIWAYLLLVFLANGMCKLSGFTVQNGNAKSRELFLDDKQKFFFKWTNTSNSLIMNVQVKATGWLALAYSVPGSPKDSDLFIAWVDRKGNGQISGRLRPAVGFGYPPRNPNQHYTLLSSRKNATHLSFSVYRPLILHPNEQGQNITKIGTICSAGKFDSRFANESGDLVSRTVWDNAFHIETFGPATIIWAYSDVIPADAESLTQHKDSTRGRKMIVLSPTKSVIYRQRYFGN